MKVEIFNGDLYWCNPADAGDTEILCKIELTLVEAKCILHSLSRTNCKGQELTVSMELEDILAKKLELFLKY